MRSQWTAISSYLKLEDENKNMVIAYEYFFMNDTLLQRINYSRFQLCEVQKYLTRAIVHPPLTKATVYTHLFAGCKMCIYPPKSPLKRGT